MASLDQFINDGGADEAGGSGHKNTHEKVSRIDLVTFTHQVIPVN